MAEQWVGSSGQSPYGYQHPQQPYGSPQQSYGPPGGPPYAGQWGGAPPKPVASLGTWTVGLLASSGAVHAVAGVLLLFGRGTATSVVLGLSSLLMVACAVLVMVWLHQVRSNIEQLDPYQWAGRRRLPKGWAIGSWFVPVGFLWLPLQVALDVWWGTAEPTPERRRTPKLIVGWWSCWLLSWFTGVRLISSVTHQNGIRSEFHSVTTFPGNTAVSALFATAAAVLLLLVIRRVTALQTARLGR